jgi:hypothetical protein
MLMISLTVRSVAHKDRIPCVSPRGIHPNHVDRCALIHGALLDPRKIEKIRGIRLFQISTYSRGKTPSRRRKLGASHPSCIDMSRRPQFLRWWLYLMVQPRLFEVRLGFVLWAQNSLSAGAHSENSSVGRAGACTRCVLGVFYLIR